MGTVNTDLLIEAQWKVENHSQRGVFGLVSRDPSQTIRVIMEGPAHRETIYVVNAGDAVTFNLDGVTAITIEADSYPTRALVDFTNGDILLAAAPFFTASAAIGQAHFDATATGVGTTTLWTPSPGKRFVISTFMLSTDTGGRVALCEGADTAGKRIAAPYLAADGGMVGGPYGAQAINTPLILVSPAGNTFVAVDGYESS